MNIAPGITGKLGEPGQKANLFYLNDKMPSLMPGLLDV